MNPIRAFKPAPDHLESRRVAQHRQSRLTKPPGSLGQLEELAVSLCALQGAEQPSARPAAALICAADHPVTRHGVSAYPAAVTPAMVANILAGGAASIVLANAAGVPLTLLDVGVDNVPALDGRGVNYVRRDVGPGGDIRVEDGMSVEVFERAVNAGAVAVDDLGPLRVLAIGELGIGNTTAAAAVASAVLRDDPALLVGPGTGVAGAALENKLQVVREAVERVGEVSPAEALRRLGGRELAAMAGAMGRAAERGIAVIVDGFIASAAALALLRSNAALRPAFFFATQSMEPGHESILDALGALPLLSLGYRLGEGTGALTAVPLFDMAVAIHNDMATFESAAVPDNA